MGGLHMAGEEQVAGSVARMGPVKHGHTHQAEREGTRSRVRARARGSAGTCALLQKQVQNNHTAHTLCGEGGEGEKWTRTGARGSLVQGVVLSNSWELGFAC